MIAARLGVRRKVVAGVYDPLLHRLGLIRITGRGRMLERNGSADDAPAPEVRRRPRQAG